MLAPIIPTLWFDSQALEAAEFYVSVFPNARVRGVTRYPADAPGSEGQVMSAEWEIDGQRFTGLNGRSGSGFSEAVSFLITCADQAEVDRLWEGLLAAGGEESMCGWLKDRFGVSWQVIPAGLGELLGDPDPARAQRATAAMLQMRKIDLAALRAAADAEA